MHGSPLSKWDNRDIWNSIDYKNYGIICEPYFDIDFKNMSYLTDTGRKWNSSKENVRDKVGSRFTYNYKFTFDVIDAIEKKQLSDKIMINIHPQRWTNNNILWLTELISQNCKNVIKRLI